jgi:hypothetical protein
MKLKDILYIACPPRPPGELVAVAVAVARAAPTQMQMHSDGCALSANTYNLLRISFEHVCAVSPSPSPCTNAHPRRMSPKTEAVAVAVAHHTPPPPNNPIYRILHRTDDVKPAGAAFPPKVRNTQPHPHPKTTRPLLTRGVWDTSAIAPLIRWLDKKGIRTVHSDWVTHRTNGERVQIVSQRGVVLENRQYAKTTQYTCHGGFRNIYLGVSRCSVTDATTTTTCETELFALPTNGAPYQHGVYTTQYQHRVYAWAANTHIHLSTTDSKQYRVTVEHNVGRPVAAADADTADTETETVLHLIASLSYHLSHHVRRPDSQRRQRKPSRHCSA